MHRASLNSDDAHALERRRRTRASTVAAVVAGAVFLVAVVLGVARGAGDQPHDGVKTTTATETKKAAGKVDSVTSTNTTETTRPAAEPSVAGRVLESGAAPFVIQVLLAGLAAFGAGALIQRVWLGEYGITVGPVSLPALAPVSEAAAAEAVGLIKDSPEVAEILGPGPRGPQPFPVFMSIEDDRLAVLAIRVELESRLRSLAGAVGLTTDVAIGPLVERLVGRGVIEEKAARGLEQLLTIGDQVAAGAKLEPEAAKKLRDQAYDVLYAVGELTRRANEGE